VSSREALSAGTLAWQLTFDQVAAQHDEPIDARPPEVGDLWQLHTELTLDGAVQTNDGCDGIRSQVIWTIDPVCRSGRNCDLRSQNCCSHLKQHTGYVFALPRTSRQALFATANVIIAKRWTHGDCRQQRLLRNQCPSPVVHDRQVGVNFPPSRLRANSALLHGIGPSPRPARARGRPN